MKKRTLLTWIAGSNVNIAEVISHENGKFSVTNPMVMVNSMYSYLPDGTPTHPDDPNRIGGPGDPNAESNGGTNKQKFHYDVNMMPYVFPGHVGKNREFTITEDSIAYTIIADEDCGAYKQYMDVTSKLA